MILEPSFECATPRDICSLQRSRLRLQQSRLAKVPAYRHLLRSSRRLNAIKQITLVNGEAYSNSHSAFLKLSGNALAYVDVTSGTTGAPKMRFVTDGDDAIDIRLLARSFCSFGVRQSDRVLFADVGDLNLFAIGSKALSSLGNDRAVFYGARLPFAQSFREAFRIFDPDVLFTIPSVLMRGFAALREHLQSSSRLRSIIYTGEHFDDKIRHYLSDSYGIEVFSLYSSIELGFIGAECRQHDGDHVWADALMPHIAGATTVQQTVFRRQGKVLRGLFGATQLLHEGSPTFMYQTGDIVCPRPRSAVVRAAQALYDGQPIAHL
jgi:phenylacetate-coenzyme A ligase PaaK-like adenylate-forming protein